jgi:hypothetical protein
MYGLVSGMDSNEWVFGHVSATRLAEGSKAEPFKCPETLNMEFTEGSVPIAWQNIRTLVRLKVKFGNSEPVAGTVDDIANDQTMAWICVDGRGRVLVLDSDDATFWELK